MKELRREDVIVASSVMWQPITAISATVGKELERRNEDTEHVFSRTWNAVRRLHAEGVGEMEADNGKGAVIFCLTKSGAELKAKLLLERQPAPA